jgi:hypothetical protein
MAVNFTSGASPLNVTIWTATPKANNNYYNPVGSADPFYIPCPADVVSDTEHGNTSQAQQAQCNQFSPGYDPTLMWSQSGITLNAGTYDVGAHYSHGSLIVQVSGTAGQCAIPGANPIPVGKIATVCFINRMHTEGQPAWVETETRGKSDVTCMWDGNHTGTSLNGEYYPLDKYGGITSFNKDNPCN